MPETPPFEHGLIIGKFYPLHVGHNHLIRTALTQCRSVTVELLASVVESIPVEVRADWIRQEHPTVTLRTAMDEAEVDFASDAAWDAHMELIEGLLPAPVDAVFSSDEYGAELATRLGATWVQVDKGRVANPVHGRRIRDDVAGNWSSLSSPTREWMSRRVVVLGAESTGSTTLAEALAAAYETAWVPEYGREYTEIREGGLTAPWLTHEFDLIADRQQAMEREAARSSPRPLLLCDTDLFATTLWHERYLGERVPRLEARAAEHRPILYILTGDEIPFVQDGMRDGEHIRHAMQDRFREALAAQPVPWLEVRGSVAERVAAARPAIDAALAESLVFALPLELRSTPVDTLSP